MRKKRAHLIQFHCMAQCRLFLSSRTIYCSSQQGHVNHSDVANLAPAINSSAGLLKQEGDTFNSKVAISFFFSVLLELEQLMFI